MLSNENLYSCQICPHKCGVNRFAETGFCNTNNLPLLSSVFLHTGEEPVLSGSIGVCNVFFAHCNLQCIYCQNYQISGNVNNYQNWKKTIDDTVALVIPLLEKGTRMLGFVSPTHQVVQMIQIIESLHKRGYHPSIIYNTNCYDNVDTLKELEGIVDIYLPDFKYVNNELGYKYSGVSNYFDVALLALKEMVRQKGTSLLIGDDNLALSGLIVRHLVLPSYTQESINLLRFLADEFSPRLHVSLMSQYFPPENLKIKRPLNRSLNNDEYRRVLEVLDEIGFRGWVQTLDSPGSYRPDFSSDIPFVK